MNVGIIGYGSITFDTIGKIVKAKTTKAIPSVTAEVDRSQTLVCFNELMMSKDMTFEQVVARVATKGGITEEGTKVVYENFPQTADELFRKTLEKRRMIAERAK